MANAYKDENSVSTLIASSNVDGKTIVRVKADALTNNLLVSDGTTGMDHGSINASRDDNNTPVLIAVSSADGFTPVEVYADTNGNLLIDSN